MNKMTYIIIPIHNRKSLTLACLKNLKNNSSLQKYQVIVVVDGSSDRNSEEVTVSHLEFTSFSKNTFMKQLPNHLLAQITQKLVVNLHPEQIILFGSYAYGEPTEDSDIDLLVIVAQSDEPRYRRSRQAYKALRGIGISKDILVMTRAEVERKANVPSSLISQVLSQGKVLYG